MSTKSKESKTKLGDFKVEAKNYQGPLDKLLELVEKEDMDIELVSLARVTGDFLEYLDSLRSQDIAHRVIADFLIVASKLLLIKSKVLIPALDLDEEEEEDIADLQLQLRIYKAIKEVKDFIEESWSVAPRSYGREFLMIQETFFYPPKSLTPNDLRESLRSVMKEVEKLRPAETIERQMVSLESKVEEILSLIQDKASIRLNEAHGEGAKGELVALFLAVLHLFKDELIHAQQDGHFGEIHVKASSDEV